MRKSGRIESDRQKQIHRTRTGGVHPVRMISTIHATPDARGGMGAHGDGSQNRVDSPPMLASTPGKLKK